MHNVGNWRYMPDAKKVVFVWHCRMTDKVEVFNLSGAWHRVLDLNRRNVTTSNTNFVMLFSLVLLYFVSGQFVTSCNSMHLESATTS